MEAILKLAQNRENLDLKKFFVTVLNEENNQQFIVQLNTDEQLEFGLLADGSVLPDYSEKSVSDFGKRQGPWRMLDTGEFWQSIEIRQITGDSFQIFGETYKPEEDVDILFTGNPPLPWELLGLNQGNTQRFIDFIIPQFRAMILETLLKIA